VLETRGETRRLRRPRAERLERDIVMSAAPAEKGELATQSLD
jgi:hypothetical protein